MILFLMCVAYIWVLGMLCLEVFWPSKTRAKKEPVSVELSGPCRIDGGKNHLARPILRQYEVPEILG
jgi:hypothetical protein